MFLMVARRSLYKDENVASQMCAERERRGGISISYREIELKSEACSSQRSVPEATFLTRVYFS